MNEEKIIQIMRDHLMVQFPKDCPSCGKRFETFSEYLRSKDHVGLPISYDAELNDWEP